MEAPALSLIVLRSKDTEAALAFYAALGLRFVREQHGSGPVHFSCGLGGSGGVVLEIYPAQAGAPCEPRASGSAMLGLRVASLEGVLEALQELGAEPKSEPQNAPWGRWVNVADPDGRTVQLSQAAQ